MSAAAGDVRHIVVLRHGQTGHNAAGMWQGQLDTDLSDVGRAQAQAAASVLAALHPRVVVSSDLRRAADTARAVARAADLDVRLDPRLREIHAGQWQGMAHTEIEARFPVENAAVRAGDDIRRGIDGERVADVVVRARPAFDDAVASLGLGEVGIVVSHGVTARALAADVLGLEQHVVWTTFRGLDNAHWAVLERGEGPWRLAAWNAGPPASL